MLSLRTLTKRYPGAPAPAVAAVDLDVEEGELLCLLGPSGCGKSTLLRMIAGLLPIDEGGLAISGEDMTRRSANKRPTAMVFQSHALWTHMSVARNVSFGLRVRRVDGQEARRRVADALALVGLSGFEGRLPAELSGGQAQRVALARCLVVEPRVLLMDEPFSALDAHLRQHLREELKALQRRLGLTTVFVTHDQDEAMELADRVAVMNEGRIEQLGAPGELYLSPRTTFVAGFLGQMNRSPVNVRAGQMAWHGVPLSCSVPDGAYEAAVRPEDIEATACSNGTARPVQRVDLGSSLRTAYAVGDAVIKVVGRREAPFAPARLWPRRMLLYRDGLLVETVQPEIPGP